MSKSLLYELPVTPEEAQVLNKMVQAAGDDTPEAEDVKTKVSALVAYIEAEAQAEEAEALFRESYEKDRDREVIEAF